MLSSEVPLNLSPHLFLFRLGETILVWLAAAALLVDFEVVHGGLHWDGGSRTPAFARFLVEARIKLKIDLEAASDFDPLGSERRV